MHKVYHVAAPNGNRFGKMDLADILDGIGKGDLPTDTHIWKEGMDVWLPISSLFPTSADTQFRSITSALKCFYFYRFCDFHGRAGRPEFWLAFLGNIILGSFFLLFFFLLSAFLLSSNKTEALLLLYLPFLLFFCYTIIPSIALTVRRLHDIGLSGWFYLIIFIPFGALVLFVCTLLPSGRPNRWGYRSDGPPNRIPRDEKQADAASE